jgi:hypothetical protein
MEKMGVVRPDVTPDTAVEDNDKVADCTKSQIVDNNKRKIEQLDHDFRKQAAERVSGKLNQ